MQRDDGAKVVTVDEGSGPVKVVKAPGGRLVTRDQVDAARQKQEADLGQVTQMRDRLVAGDADATAQVVAQVRDNLQRRAGALARQKEQLDQTLAKLKAGDAQATAQIVGQMVHRLSRRAQLVAAAKDRSAALLVELDAK